MYMKTYISFIFAILFCGAFSLYGQAMYIFKWVCGAHRDTLKKTFQKDDFGFLLEPLNPGISGDKDGTVWYGQIPGS